MEYFFLLYGKTGHPFYKHTDWVRNLFCCKLPKQIPTLTSLINGYTRLLLSRKKSFLPANFQVINWKFIPNHKFFYYSKRVGLFLSPPLFKPTQCLERQEYKIVFAKKSHLNAWTKVCHILWAKSHRQPHPPILQIARNKSGTFQHNSPRQSLDHVALLSWTVFGAMSNLQLLLTTSNRPIPLDWCQILYHHPQKTEDPPLILMLLSTWFLANFCWHIKRIHRVGTWGQQIIVRSPSICKQ